MPGYDKWLSDERLRQLGKVDTAGQPWGSWHPKMICDCLQMSLSEQDLQNIRDAYIYLSAYYFCLDDIVDGHPVVEHQPIYLAPLFGRASALFATTLLKHQPSAGEKLCELFTELTDDNASAMQLELDTRSTIEPLDMQAARASIVGRSNSFLFLWKYCAELRGQSLPDDLPGILEDFLLWGQHGDDLGDWRDDFNGGRHTQFLRFCLDNTTSTPTEEELERFVYGTGAYERFAASILDNLMRVSTRVSSLGPAFTPLNDFVEEQCQRLESVLSNFIRSKLALHGAPCVP